MQNKVTTILTPEVSAKVIESVQHIQNDLPFLIELSPVESKRMTRMEAGRIDFVRRAHLQARANEKLRPQFFEIDEMEKDLNFCQAFDKVITVVESLLKQMQDTQNQAGHEAYSAALEIYNITKRGTTLGIPGAQLAYEDLKIMFAAVRRPNKDEPNPAP
jgi:hypothetical protein